MTCEKRAEKLKTYLQYGVGCYIFFFIIIKTYVFLGIPFWSPANTKISVFTYILSKNTLALVSQAMLVSAAIELAYMLFTPGPDEAVDPLILGIAGTALLVMSDNNSAPSDSVLGDALAVLLLSLALALLFYLRYKLTKWFPKQFRYNESESTNSNFTAHSDNQDNIFKDKAA